MKEEADASVAAYEQELAAARKNAADIGNKAREEAKAKADAERKLLKPGSKPSSPMLKNASLKSVTQAWPKSAR